MGAIYEFTIDFYHINLFKDDFFGFGFFFNYNLLCL